jgi:hypothetical protein
MTFAFWVISVVIYTPLPFLLCYALNVMRKRRHLREGWMQRL